MGIAPSSTPTPRPWPWILLLVFCCLWLGFVAGMMIGGRYYGFGGALAGAVLAALLSWKLPARSLRLAALAAPLLAGLATALLVLGVVGG